MGCDYYIVKVLEVEYLNDDDQTEIIQIEINKKRRYFQIDESEFDSDSDIESEMEICKPKLHEKYSKYLQVTYTPKILFNNKKWKSENIQEKYEDLILNEINIKDILILNVIKKEIRYLR